MNTWRVVAATSRCWQSLTAADRRLGLRVALDVISLAASVVAVLLLGWSLMEAAPFAQGVAR